MSHFNTDYRTHLDQELKRRRSVNPSYSLRSFARTLGINPGFLSSVLNGKRSLSAPMALTLAQKLGWSESAALKVESVTLNQFRVISDWYHLAILELTFLKDFKPDPAWIGSKIGIPAEEARSAIERLLALGLLERSGKTYKKSARHIGTVGDVPSQAVRNFHLQMIEKAKASIQEQSIDERHIAGTTFSISRTDVITVKREIEKFRNRLRKILDHSAGEEVYQLEIQFFNLTHPGKIHNKENQS